jgi:DNA-binding NtrC family response regulator
MNPPKGRVLILDDDILVAMNNKDIIESLGYQCRLAHKLEDAHHFIQKINFCMVLCDHDLPDGKGFQLIKKTALNQPELPFIYLSAAPDSVLKEINAIPQIKQILTKPTTAVQLISAIKKLKLKDDFIPNRIISLEERKMLLDIYHNDDTSEQK